jgi:hypothetical protein
MYMATRSFDTYIYQRIANKNCPCSRGAEAVRLILHVYQIIYQNAIETPVDRLHVANQIMCDVGMMALLSRIMTVLFFVNYHASLFEKCKGIPLLL